MGSSVAKQSDRRLAENEVIFRQANKDMEDFLKDTGAADATTVPFFCECSDTNCRGRIEISVRVYEALHNDKRRFVVIAGHQIPKIENVVQREQGFYVVEKHGDLPTDEDIDIALKRLAF